MKARFLIFILLTALLGFAAEGRCGENGFSLGYGFAAFNQGRSGGKIEGGKDYNFVQATYLFEKPFSWKELALLVEPFSSYVANPTSGVDLGVGVGLKYYPARTDKGGIYFMGGTGMAYSTIGFQEQGTHLFFIGQGGIGFRYGNFFIEDRFRHYSNGGTARPNWSVRSKVSADGNDVGVGT